MVQTRPPAAGLRDTVKNMAEILEPKYPKALNDCIWPCDDIFLNFHIYLKSEKHFGLQALWLYYFIKWLCYNLLINSPINGHIGHFQYFVIMNRVEIHNFYISLYTNEKTSLGHIHRNRIPGCRSWASSILFDISKLQSEVCELDTISVFVCLKVSLFFPISWMLV